MDIVFWLLVAAFIICILSAIGKAPLWVSVLLTIIALLIGKA